MWHKGYSGGVVGCGIGGIAGVCHKGYSGCVA